MHEYANDGKLLNIVVIWAKTEIYDSHTLQCMLEVLGFSLIFNVVSILYYMWLDINVCGH